MPAPLRIGHRGASAYAVENTLAAVALARDMGADGVEVDVRATKDGVLILWHDATIKRLTGRRKAVDHLDFEALAALPLKLPKRMRIPPARVAMLEALFAQAQGMRLFLEIKHPSCALHVAGAVRRAVEGKTLLPGQAMLIGFDHAALSKVKRAMPDIPLGFSYKRAPRTLRRAIAGGADAITLCYTKLTPAVMRMAETARLPVYVWTVNEPAEMLKLKRMGVSGIMSDYPDRLDVL